nr:hypothetical protein [Tanacetum cinerariifolium]
MLSNPEVTRRLLKWRFELEEHDIYYRPRTSVKGQILADFIVERPEDDSLDTSTEDKEELPDLFDTTNNKAEYEALIAGLRIAEQIGVKNHQANVDSRLVANQVNETYIAKDPGMIRYLEKVKNLASTFKEFSIKQVPRGENKKADALSKMTSTNFAHLSKQTLVEELKEKSIDEKEVLAANYVLREIHEGSCSMHAGPRSVVAKALRSGYYLPTMYAEARKLIKGVQKMSSSPPRAKEPAANLTPITSPFGLPGEIISDNGKQFRDNPFKDWCEKLCIRQCFASLKHQQANGLVERANSSLDLLEEKREQATIQEAKSKAMMEKYYNSKAHSTSFKPQDLVYRSNDASRTEEVGKLGPKWEGPYKITEALGKGAYKLRNRDGKQLPRNWNVRNLKRCYVHEM